MGTKFSKHARYKILELKGKRVWSKRPRRRKLVPETVGQQNVETNQQKGG